MGFKIDTAYHFPITIPDASLTQDGVMTKAQVAKLNSSIALEDVAIYADAVNGDDANPGTFTSPVQTVARAFNLVPGLHAGKCEVHLAAGTYPIDVIAFVTPTRIGTDATPFTLIGDTPTNVLGDRVSTSVAGNTVIGDAGLATFPDQYLGSFITILTGLNTDQRRIVRSNDGAGNFTVNSPFDNPLLAGDQFRIEQPSTVFQISTIFSIGLGDSWLLKDIKFVGNVFIVRTILDNTEGCEFDGQGVGSLAIADKSTWFMNGSSVFANAPFSPLHAPASAYIHDTYFIAYDGSYTAGWAVMQNVFANAAVLSGFELADAACKTTSILLDTGSYISNENTDPTFPGVMDGDLLGDPTRGIITVNGNSMTDGDLTLELNLSHLDISNSAGHGVKVSQRSYVAFGDGVTGSGNAGVGCLVTGMSQAAFTPGITLMGAGGEAQVGSDPAQTWASLNPAGATQGLNRIEPL